MEIRFSGARQRAAAATVPDFREERNAERDPAPFESLLAPTDALHGAE